MIHVDEHGNKFLQMADGRRTPLLNASMNISLTTAVPSSDGAAQIIPVIDALALHQTSAAYWFARFQEAQTTIADLRQQLDRV